MAFVPSLTPSTFKGPPARAQLARPPKFLPANRRTAAPRMAFSSIDEPETSVSLKDSSLETKTLVLSAAYKQVFGNAYLMESERTELAETESKFLEGAITVSALIRAMAKSTEYRKRFFERSGPYAFVELNCKHLLGRAANSQEEVSFHVQKLMNDGYDAEIDSYIDSQEYVDTFGSDSVPRFVYRGEYPTNDAFNRMNVVRQHWDGCSTSTVSGSTAPVQPIAAKLTMPPGAHCGNPSAIMRGILAGHDPEPVTEGDVLLAPLNARAPIRVRIKVADNLYQVFEVPGYVEKPIAKEVPAWKKELAATAASVATKQWV